MYSILYVDDEPGLLEIAKIFLEQDKGFSVDTDMSAAHAIEPIGSKFYDAIISDYQMPGMDGIEFLKAVRQKYGDIPFILFTGRGREEVVIEAINNGADFYLQKGGDPRAQFAELAHKVRQAVARKRAEQSLVESEKRLTDIINFLPDATFAIDRAGTVIAWNRAIEEMTGVPAAEMLGKGNFEYAIPFYGTRRKILIDLIFEPDDVIAKNYANIRREKDVLIADTNLPRPLGRTVRLAGKASPLYDRQGRIVGAIEAIRDITQQERDAEQIAQKTSALSIINRIIQASNLRQTIDEYTKSVLSLTIDLLHYSAGGVYLVDDDRKIARIVCSENLPSAFIAAIDNIDIRTAPYDTLFIRGEPVIIENLATVLPQAAGVSGFHAIASIPIVSQDTVIGALNVASREASLVGREDREILVAIGRELGSAIARITAESALRESESHLRYMLGFYEKAEESENELRMYAVEGAGAVTGSPLGYLAFLNEDESVMTMYAWSKSAMAECALREKPIIYPVEKTGLWGEAVRQRRAVITNDYAAPNPRKKGYPEGHPHIVRHMNVPIFDGDHIVIVAGVANRPTDYTENEVRELTLLMQGLWHVLKRQQAERELRAANEQLTASDEELRGQYEELAFSEQRLRESEGRFRQLADATLEALVIHKAGKIVDLNESACSLFAYSREEMIGKNLLTLAGPDSVEDIRRKIAEGDDAPYEAQGLRKDGSTFWAELRSRDFSRGDENLRITTLWDITARKNAEDAVRESQERLRTFMDSATDAFTIWDKDLNLIDLNQVALSYLPQGMRKEDIIGKNFSEVILGPDGGEAYDRYLEVLRTGTPFIGTEKLPDPRYGTHWLDVKCFRVGTGLGIVTTDVTRQKEAEDELRAAYEQLTASEEELRGQLEELTTTQEKLRQSERQLAEIADTVPGVVYQFYARPDGSMGCYYISRRVSEIFGIGSEPEQFFDRITANTDPRDRDKFLDSIRSAIASVTPWNFEGRYNKPGGGQIWFQGISRPVEKGTEVIYNGILLDITARKNAEEARRASEEKYRNVIEHSPFGMHFYEMVPGRGLVFAGANSAADRILEISHRELIGKTIEDAFPGLIGTEVPDRYREAAESGKVWETEQVLYDQGSISGAYTVIAFRTTPGAMAAMFVDITGRKRAEEELLLLKVSVDQAYDEIFWMDFAGKILYVNDAACQVSGYSREELSAMKIFELDPDFPPEVWDQSVADLRERKKQFITTRHRCKDGRIIDVEIAATYVYKNGREYSFAFVRDITDRKRLEEELFSSQQMLQGVLDSIPQRVFWKDRNSVFLGCNKSLALDAGFSDPAELIGKTDYDHASHEMADLYRADDRQVMETGQPKINFEEPQVRPDGSHAWLRTSKVALRNQNGEIIGVLGTYEDITPQKLAQEKLQESEERYRSLVESSFDGIAIHQDGILVFVNSTAARLLGYGDPSGLLGKPALDIVHPDERARVAARMAESPEKPLELAHERLQRADGRYIDADVATTPCTWEGKPAVYVTFRDISDLMRTGEALEKRLVALTRPLEDKSVSFDIEDLFDIGEIQRLQDEFAKATGVAVLLTRPDGTPITKPSNFCRLCSGIVRSTEKGRERCFKSDSELGGFHGGSGPYIHTCLSAGLWGAGANIVVGDRHIANWLIGQVRNETQTEEDMRNYAREIGVDEKEFIRAFLEVPVMPTGQFAAVAQALSTLANLLSRLAFQNVQQARFITERERAEEELRQKTEELNQYFTASLDLFCIADTSGYFRRLNPEWEKTLGYTLAELEGKRFLDFVHPDDLPSTLEAVRRLSDQQEVLNFTNRYRHKDGSYRWIEWRSFPHGDRVFAAARDITGRKRMEEELRESEERYRSLFENSYAVMLLIDPETGVIIDANPAACAYYGWNHDELVAKTIDEINTLTPDQVKAEMKAARTQKRSHFLFRHRRANGTVRDVEVYSGPLRIKGRDLLHSIVIDVTERKRIEQDLKASEELLRLFIRHAPAALAMFDTEMRYLAASRRWMADYHLGNRDILSRSHYEVFPEIPEEIKAVHRRALAGEVVSADEEKFVREDGSVQWLTWEVRPWYTTGNAIGGIIIFSEDITRRKQAEEALRESEEKHRNLVENSLSIIYTMLPDGTFTFVSPSWKKFLGHEPSEVVGKNFRTFVHPDDIPMCEDFLKLIVDSGGVQTNTGDYRIYHKDGSVHWNRSSVMPVFDAAGDLTLLVGNAIDVTTRKRAEDALLESRAELASILHGSPVLQFVIDRNHRIVSWNKALEEYTHLSAEDAIGTDQQWRPFYPEKRPVLADLLVDNNTDGLYKWYGGDLKPSPYVEGAYEATGFFPMVGASGSWLSFTAAPIRNAEGEIIGAVETLEDITERVNAEAALRKSEERFREIVEQSTDVFYRQNIRTGKFEYYSPKVRDVFGYTPDEMTAMDIEQQKAGIHPDDLPGLLSFPADIVAADARGEKIISREFRIRRKDGEYRWIHGNYTLTRDAEGSPSMIIGSLNDITLRKQAEDAVRDTGEKYRRILENMQDAYFRVDENGIITMANPSAARMYGYGSADEMVGIAVASLYVNGEKQRSELVRKLQESGGVTDFSGEAIRKDGTIFWVSLNAQYFTDWEGRVQGTEGIVRDVSERRAMERAIREANRKLSLLGSITRHDVANKVAIITGFAQAARMQKISPETAVYLSKIEAAGGDIARQIAFTKSYQELGVKAPAWQGVRELVGRQKADGVTLTCTCDAEILADPMLEKVVSNLVDNAVRHGERVTDISVTCERGPEGLVIAVADNGVGVPAKLKEKIFERGFGKHTGFGLFLAREILAITGITIRETGTPGEGAKFEMVVPEGGYRGG